jgi:hypothetical protein
MGCERAFAGDWLGLAFSFAANVPASGLAGDC